MSTCEARVRVRVRMMTMHVTLPNHPLRSESGFALGSMSLGGAPLVSDLVVGGGGGRDRRLTDFSRFT